MGSMETADKDHKQVDMGRKWIRLMQVGVALFFVMPFAIIFAALTRDAVLVSLVFLGFLASGNLCLRYGKHKREEIQQNGKTND